MLNVAALIISIAPALTLRAEFRESWRALGGRAPAAVFDAVAARYAEPGRAYHRLDHIVDCGQKLSAFAAADQMVFAARPMMIVAFVFHDAVYDLRPHATTNNERESQRLFRAYGITIDPAAARVIDDLILATRAHAGTNHLEDVFIDIDLSILGADPTSFAAFERAIRREYAWVDDDTYRRRRAEVLTNFLSRDPLFKTPFARARFEARARQNLTRLIRELTTPAPTID